MLIISGTEHVFPCVVLIEKQWNLQELKPSEDFLGQIFFTDEYFENLATFTP